MHEASPAARAPHLLVRHLVFSQRGCGSTRRAELSVSFIGFITGWSFEFSMPGFFSLQGEPGLQGLPGRVGYSGSDGFPGVDGKPGPWGLPGEQVSCGQAGRAMAQPASGGEAAAAGQETRSS